MVRWFALLLTSASLLPVAALPDEKFVNLNDLKSDLTVPTVTDEKPAAGKR